MICNHTTTQTPGEILSWRREGNKIVFESNLAKNEFVLDADQAITLAGSVAIMYGEIVRSGE